MFVGLIFNFQPVGNSDRLKISFFVWLFGISEQLLLAQMGLIFITVGQRPTEAE